MNLSIGMRTFGFAKKHNKINNIEIIMNSHCQMRGKRRFVRNGIYVIVRLCWD